MGVTCDDIIYIYYIIISYAALCVSDIRRNSAVQARL